MGETCTLAGSCARHAGNARRRYAREWRLEAVRRLPNKLVLLQSHVRGMQVRVRLEDARRQRERLEAARVAPTRAWRLEGLIYM